MERKEVMASKKKIEAVASKSVDDMSKAVLELQQKARESLAAIDGAFVEKQQELRDVLTAIDEKKVELEELYGKEKIGQELVRLEEELEDKRHQHERALARLAMQFSDAKFDQERQHKLRDTEREQRLADADRDRIIRIAEEDRQRQIDFRDRDEELNKRKVELDAKEQEVGSFEERLKAEVGKAEGMMKRRLEIEARQKEVEQKAVIDILEARVKGQAAEITDLKDRLVNAEVRAEEAIKKSEAIAIATVNAEAGKQALDELRQVSHKQAESRK